MKNLFVGFKFLKTKSGKHESLDKKIFVEPNLPNYQIGIMHLAAGIWVDKTDMRVSKNLKIEIETLSGEKLSKSLRYQN